MCQLSNITPYPFSKEIYGISSKRGNKFQVSISMILAGIFKKLRESKFDFSILDDHEELLNFAQQIKLSINNSHLENPNYKASTTNPVEVDKVVSSFTI